MKKKQNIEYTQNYEDFVFLYKKGKIKKIIMVFIILIILSFSGFYLFKKITTDPSIVLKEAINVTYHNINALLNKEYPKITDFKIDGEITMQTSLPLYKKVKNNKLSWELKTNLKDAYLTTRLLESDKTLMTNNFILANKTLYYTQDKFQNSYELYHFPSSKIKQITLDEAKYLLQVIKKSMTQSLNKDYMHQEEVELYLNDKEVQGSKVSYALNRASIKDFSQTFFHSLMEDEDAIAILLKLTNYSKNDLLNKLEDFDEDKTYQNLNDSGSLNIYTVNNKFVKLELTYAENLLSYEDEKVSLTFKDKNDTWKLNIDQSNLSISKNNQQLLAIAKTNDEDTTRLTYTSHIKKIPLTGSLTFNIDKATNKKINYDIVWDNVMTILSKEQNITLNFTGSYTYNNDLIIDDKENFVTGSLTDDDQKEYEKALKKYNNSNFAKLIKQLSFK